MKISPLAKDAAKRIADNLNRGGHCELFLSDMLSMENAIQGVIDQVQWGGFMGEEIGISAAPIPSLANAESIHPESKPPTVEEPRDEGLDETPCSAFSEATIKTPGWYFCYPKHPEAGGKPKYVEIDQDAIEDGWLRCRKYAGTYMGPIIPPSLANDERIHGGDESPNPNKTPPAVASIHLLSSLKL